MASILNKLRFISLIPIYFNDCIVSSHNKVQRLPKQYLVSKQIIRKYFNYVNIYWVFQKQKYSLLFKIKPPICFLNSQKQIKRDTRVSTYNAEPVHFYIYGKFVFLVYSKFYIENKLFLMLYINTKATVYI